MLRDLAIAQTGNQKPDDLTLGFRENKGERRLDGEADDDESRSTDGKVMLTNVGGLEVNGPRSGRAAPLHPRMLSQSARVMGSRPSSAWRRRRGERFGEVGRSTRVGETDATALRQCSCRRQRRGRRESARWMT